MLSVFPGEPATFPLSSPASPFDLVSHLQGTPLLSIEEPFFPFCLFFLAGRLKHDEIPPISGTPPFFDVDFLWPSRSFFFSLRAGPFSQAATASPLLAASRSITKACHLPCLWTKGFFPHRSATPLPLSIGFADR